MRMRLLNLDRSTDRLALFKARNPHHATIQRVSAIDGRKLNRKRLVETSVLMPDLSYTDGALGCALSHLAQWRDAIQTDTVLTVVEDDAVLCANFEQEASRIIASLPENWEYVMWGYNFDAPLHLDLGATLSPCIAHFDQNALRSDIGRFASSDVRSLPFRLVSGFGTICYSISPRGAMRLLDFCLPLRPMATYYDGLQRNVINTGIDIMMAQLWPKVPAYVAMPPLAVTENDGAGSTVQHSTHALSHMLHDPFPPRTLLAIGDEVESAAPLAIGIRAASHTSLPTEALRASDWGGFDIAVSPPALAQALRDRGVPSRFDLLYVGPGCDPGDIVTHLLPEFRPGRVVLPPEPFLAAQDLGRWRRNRAVDQAEYLRPTYLDFVQNLGYSAFMIPEMPSHTVLVSDDGVSDSDGSGLEHVSVRDHAAVRLWQ